MSTQPNKKPRRTKHWLTLIATFLVLGTLVNIAVAWQMYRSHTGTTTLLDSKDSAPSTQPICWPSIVPTDWPPPQTRTHISGGGFRGEIITHAEPLEPPSPQPMISTPFPPWPKTRLSHTHSAFQWGWPMRSVVSADATTRSLSASFGPINPQELWRYSNSNDQFVWFHTGIKPPAILSISPSERLPIRPLPLGFTLNTIFYAILLYLPLFTFTTLKRHRRKFRGLCTTCGYNLTGLTTCPECGQAATGRSQ